MWLRHEAGCVCYPSWTLYWFIYTDCIKVVIKTKNGKYLRQYILIDIFYADRKSIRLSELLIEKIALNCFNVFGCMSVIYKNNLIFWWL